MHNNLGVPLWNYSLYGHRKGPYYLTKVEKGKSAIQIIETLAFSKNGFLLEEFDELFSSLFDNDDIYTEIVKIIAKNPYGIGKRKLMEKIGAFATGGGVQG